MIVSCQAIKVVAGQRRLFGCRSAKASGSLVRLHSKCAKSGHSAYGPVSDIQPCTMVDRAKAPRAKQRLLKSSATTLKHPDHIFGGKAGYPQAKRVSPSDGSVLNSLILRRTPLIKPVHDRTLVASARPLYHRLEDSGVQYPERDVVLELGSTRGTVRRCKREGRLSENDNVGTAIERNLRGYTRNGRWSDRPVSYLWPPRRRKSGSPADPAGTPQL